MPGAVQPGEYRSSIATRDLKQWLEKVGLPYHSPHKFRHGNAVYSLKMAKDIQALKAVSQNLMHSNISITDGVYGVLFSSDVGQRIAGLGNQFDNTKISRADLANQLIKLGEILKGTADNFRPIFLLFV